MDWHDAEKMALDLMGQHDLLGNSWILKFSRSKRKAGACDYFGYLFSDGGIIWLSGFLVANNDEATVRDTVLHEIAHALAGAKTGHGDIWQSICKRIGAKPTRCFTDDKVVMPKGRWRAKCQSCNTEHHRHRRPKNIHGYYCIRCGPTVGKIVWQAV